MAISNITVGVEPNVSNVYQECTCDYCKQTFKHYSQYIWVKRGEKVFCSYNCVRKYDRMVENSDSVSKPKNYKKHEYKERGKRIVNIYDKLTEELVATFDSVDDTAMAMGLSKATIMNYCNGRSQNDFYIYRYGGKKNKGSEN